VITRTTLRRLTDRIEAVAGPAPGQFDHLSDEELESRLALLRSEWKADYAARQRDGIVSDPETEEIDRKIAELIERIETRSEAEQ
jgi:uncharacterized small protein (DUF1192 family)